MPSDTFTVEQLREIINRQEQEIREQEIQRVHLQEEIKRLHLLLKPRRSRTEAGSGARCTP